MVLWGMNPIAQGWRRCYREREIRDPQSPALEKIPSPFPHVPGLTAGFVFVRDIPFPGEAVSRQ
jgi:hypothetical protein